MFRFPDYIFLRNHAKMMQRREKLSDKESLAEQLIQMHEGLTLVAAENIELKAELDQCLTAHAVLNDKVCALEAVASQLADDRDKACNENDELKAKLESSVSRSIGIK